MLVKLFKPALSTCSCQNYLQSVVKLNLRFFTDNSSSKDNNNEKDNWVSIAEKKSISETNVNQTKSDQGNIEAENKNVKEDVQNVKELNQQQEQYVHSPEAQNMMRHLYKSKDQSSSSTNEEQKQEELAKKINKGAKKFSILFGPSADYMQPYLLKQDQKKTEQDFQGIQEGMAHPETGYSDLGQYSQEAEDTEFSMSRIHPTTIFQPGDTYAPEDLNPFESSEEIRRQQQQQQSFLRKPKQPKYTDVDVRQKGDFTNIPFLVNFMSQTGKILPQRISRLGKRCQRRISKYIKTARMMALMPPEGRPTIGLLDAKTIKRIKATQEERLKLLESK
eukprot:TRINITY_DN3128_c0_g2_i6.p1 TRINITY_DN3128_c0_g2~~TRINITY_DN3128_c0_g2_i6.p1  ORF type:complete len:334 (-),score=40.74 TRINITY_DN3128_c0_g2_i6:1307-2308(-)